MRPSRRPSEISHLRPLSQPQAATTKEHLSEDAEWALVDDDELIYVAKRVTEDGTRKIGARSRLGVRIHEAVREAIERAVEEELEAALGAVSCAST